VGITSITADKTTSSTSSTALLKDGIFAMLDSTVPYFYLPQSICEAFESAFGLKWNTTSELYTLSGSQHAALTKLNPSITFTLAPDIPATAVDQSVDITLPYSAFDLNISWPYTNASTAYFPLKRARNETQYTLGRAFFQEAYVIADYERQNFSVWPCKWDSDTNNAKVLPILSKDANSTEGSNSNASESPKGGLSTGAIAGIAVGAALGIIGLAIAAWYFLVKKPRSPKRTSLELEASENTGGRTPDGLPLYYPKKQGNVELDSRPRHELPDHEAKLGILEAPSDRAKFEMDGTETPTELYAGGKTNMVHELDARPVAGKLEPVMRGTPGSEAVMERSGEVNYFTEERDSRVKR
jgi:hypothetical protein